MTLRVHGRHTLTVLALLAACAGRPVAAQDSPPPLFVGVTPWAATRDSAATVTGTDVVVAAAGGILGAAVGVLGGGFLGANIETRFSPCSCDDPGLAGFLLGAGIGGALMSPVGVHAFDAGRGDLKRAIMGSLIGGAAMTALAFSTDTGLILVIPAAEIVGAVMGELGTRRR